MVHDFSHITFRNTEADKKCDLVYEMVTFRLLTVRPDDTFQISKFGDLDSLYNAITDLHKEMTVTGFG
jgi:hypothetical protein